MVDERIRRIESDITSAESGWRGRTFTLAERMQQLSVPGVTAAVFDAGQLEWARGWGVRGSEAGPVTPATMFSAGSVSKPVAAAAAMRLVEQGMIGLDDDVNTYLRSWRVPAVDGWQPSLTLRQLLSHTAGLTVHGFPGYLRTASIPTPQQILDGAEPANTAPVRVDILPGTQFRYSGGGTTVMQVLLEDVTGTPFVQLVSELVLEPLGMERSSYEQPLPDTWGDVAVGHYAGGATVPGDAYVMPELAAAGLYTTPTDLTRFGLAVRSALRGDDETLFSRETAEQMLDARIPARNGRIAQGFFIEGEGTSLRFGHGGSNIGFKCQLVVYRERGCGAAVMTNGEAGATIVAELLQAIAREYDWPEFVASEPMPYTPDEVILQQYVGHYELRPGWTASVTLSDVGQLALTVPGQPALALRAISETTFVCEGLRSRVVFGQDSAEWTMTIEQADESLVARRIGL